MRKTALRTIGILAGGGKLPNEIANSIKIRGGNAEVVAIKSEADADIARLDPTYVEWGQVGAIVRAFKRAHCAEIVIVGSVSRPDLGAIKPDLGFFSALLTIIKLVRAGGDDAVLRGVIAYFEKRGLSVVSPASVAPELVISKGPLGDQTLTPAQHDDAQLGFRVVHALAPFDIGQSVVVAQGNLEQVEAAEGTDAMLKRAAAARGAKFKNESSGLLVKCPKPGQDLRIDLPVIGPRTVMLSAQANLVGAAVQAGKVLAADRDNLKSVANAHKIIVEGLSASEDQARAATQTGVPNTKGDTVSPIRAFTRGLPVKVIQDDAHRGMAVIEALQPFAPDMIAVVARSHVLAVDRASARNDAAIRAAALRQWGDNRWSRRMGTLVLPEARFADEPTIKAAAQGGLACVAVRMPKFAPAVSRAAIARAKESGLSIIAVLMGKGN